MFEKSRIKLQFIVAGTFVESFAENMITSINIKVGKFLHYNSLAKAK